MGKALCFFSHLCSSDIVARYSDTFKAHVCRAPVDVGDVPGERYEVRLLLKVCEGSGEWLVADWVPAVEHHLVVGED